MNTFIQQEYKVLLEFHRICKKNGIQYFLFRDAALCAKLHQNLEMLSNNICVLMTNENYQKFVSYYNEQEKDSPYHLESLETNSKFPYLFSRYVDLCSTECNLYYIDRVKYPGVGISIYRLFPYPTKKYKQIILRFFKEGYSSASKTAKFLLPTKRKIAKYSCIFLRTILGGIFTRFVYHFGNQFTPTDKYYLEDCTKKTIFFPSDLLKEESQVIIEENSFPVPADYESYLELTYNSKKIDERFLVSKNMNGIVQSIDIPCVDYRRRVLQNVNIRKYRHTIFRLGLGQKWLKKERRIINRARNNLQRTIDYYLLEDSYREYIEDIKYAWSQYDLDKLEVLLNDYITIMKKHKKQKDYIGYDKELYIIVEKYLALTERMDMCMYMYKNQTKAIAYIEKMSAI